MFTSVEEKYPFASLLPLFAEKPSEPLTNICFKDVAAFLQKQAPKLALIIGVDVYVDSAKLVSFLDKDPSRRVIFLEKRPHQLQKLLKDEKPWLLHPQLELRFVMEEKNLAEACLDEIVCYPSDHIELLLSSYYGSFVDEKQLQVEVFRKASLVTAWFHEKAWYHFLCDNLFSNFHELTRAFDADSLHHVFLNQPAIICGAGPSLDSSAKFLKQLQNKALILAGGSTLSSLASLGVTPHLGFALDPNPEEYQRLKLAYGQTYPLLFGARLEKRVLKEWKGPIGYMKTSSGGFLEQKLQHLLNLQTEPLLKGLSEEALSVTTMALSAAVSLGCHPIYLVGIDLAYVEDKRYASGVVEISENDFRVDKTTSCTSKQIECLNREHKLVTTSIKWIMEKEAIEAFAKDHPEITIVDCVEQGLGFASLPKQSLENLIDTLDIYPQKLVARALSAAPQCSYDTQVIEDFFVNIRHSVESCLNLVNHLITLCEKNAEHNLEESALGTLYIMDLEQDEIFNYLVQPLEEYSQALFKTSLQKWQHYKEILQSYLSKL
jgi:hypothetical protein